MNKEEKLGTIRGESESMIKKKKKKQRRSIMDGSVCIHILLFGPDSGADMTI